MEENYPHFRGKIVHKVQGELSKKEFHSVILFKIRNKHSIIAQEYPVDCIPSWNFLHFTDLRSVISPKSSVALFWACCIYSISYHALNVEAKARVSFSWMVGITILSSKSSPGTENIAAAHTPRFTAAYLAFGCKQSAIICIPFQSNDIWESVNSAIIEEFQYYSGCGKADYAMWKTPCNSTRTAIKFSVRTKKAPKQPKSVVSLLWG